MKAQNPAWIGRRRRDVRRVFLGGAAWGGLRSGEGFIGRSLGGLGGPVTAVSRGPHAPWWPVGYLMPLLPSSVAAPGGFPAALRRSRLWRCGSRGVLECSSGEVLRLLQVPKLTRPLL